MPENLHEAVPLSLVLLSTRGSTPDSVMLSRNLYYQCHSHFHPDMPLRGKSNLSANFFHSYVTVTVTTQRSLDPMPTRTQCKVTTAYCLNIDIFSFCIEEPSSTPWVTSGIVLISPGPLQSALFTICTV